MRRIKKIKIPEGKYCDEKCPPCIAWNRIDGWCSLFEEYVEGDGLHGAPNIRCPKCLVDYPSGQEPERMKWYKSKSAAKKKVEKLEKEGYIVEWGRLGMHFWVDIIENQRSAR